MVHLATVVRVVVQLAVVKACRRDECVWWVVIRDCVAELEVWKVFRVARFPGRCDLPAYVKAVALPCSTCGLIAGVPAIVQ